MKYVMKIDKQLWNAVRRRDYESAQKALADGANCNTIHQRSSVICMAASTGEIRFITLLLEAGADLNVSDGNGTTPLSASLVLEFLHVAVFLIARGADINAKDNYGYTSLHYASQFGNSNTAKFIIDSGAALDLFDNSNQTPLIVASRYGKFHVMKLLLAAGADPTITNDEGNSPLHFIAFSGNVGIARLLLDGGADPYLSNEYGTSPIHAVQDDAMMALLTSYPRVKTLRTLCLDLIQSNKIDHQFIPPILFEHPNEVEEERAYCKRRRDFEENNPNKRR